MSRRRGGLSLLVVALAVIGAVAASWFLTRDAGDALSALDPEPVPVLAPVESVAIDYSADAMLTAELTDGADLMATGLSGTVTAVVITAGSPVSSGQVLYRVDGVPVVAYSGDVVLYRPLSSGARGADVSLAQRLLSELVPEVNLDADGVYGASTAAAVRAYERTWGASPTGTFQPEWFLYLPSDDFDVAAVTIRPGAPAPATGEPVASGATTLEGALITSATAGPAGSYEFLVQGQAIPIQLADDGTWTITDLQAATDLALAQAVDGTDTVSLNGRTRLVDGEPGQAVPAASVVSDSEGATCIAIATPESTSDATLEPVNVVGSSIDGRAQIMATLDEGALVLVNPVQMLGNLTCPSN
ncbi:peptidoglycan-binding domain-containing protein [Occultella gossypii]|uniref:Peptidoglycan-binding protein n=1 Tax=Occultella gossypii TaxID=2800820 RepID=A0ABS7SHA3_9MICO|nr:peptidoglycan-binding domain-containing protein [Occultella gossypii]MBZ2199713.1 peptidoglycan-binding protein [Occultella gossypii]